MEIPKINSVILDLFYRFIVETEGFQKPTGVIPLLDKFIAEDKLLRRYVRIRLKSAPGMLEDSVLEDIREFVRASIVDGSREHRSARWKETTWTATTINDHYDHFSGGNLRGYYIAALENIGKKKRAERIADFSRNLAIFRKVEISLFWRMREGVGVAARGVASFVLTRFGGIVSGSAVVTIAVVAVLQYINNLPK